MGNRYRCGLPNNYDYENDTEIQRHLDVNGLANPTFRTFEEETGDNAYVASTLHAYDRLTTLVPPLVNGKHRSDTGHFSRSLSTDGRRTLTLYDLISLTTLLRVCYEETHDT